MLVNLSYQRNHGQLNLLFSQKAILALIIHLQAAIILTNHITELKNGIWHEDTI